MAKYKLIVNLFRTPLQKTWLESLTGVLLNCKPNSARFSKFWSHTMEKIKIIFVHLKTTSCLLPSNINSIYLEDCSANELLDIISELQNGKSSDIYIHVIKKSAHVFCPLLPEYINILMPKGIFPDVI